MHVQVLGGLVVPGGLWCSVLNEFQHTPVCFFQFRFGPKQRVTLMFFSVVHLPAPRGCFQLEATQTCGCLKCLPTVSRSGCQKYPAASPTSCRFVQNLSVFLQMFISLKIWKIPSFITHVNPSKLRLNGKNLERTQPQKRNDCEDNGARNHCSDIP